MPKPPDGTARRRCGDCTACCTLMGVPDLEPPKPPGVKCAHVCARGCKIYSARPSTCREFNCVWVQGGLPKPMRPDRVGIVFTSDGERLVGFWDPARPGLWRKNGLPDFLRGVSSRGAEVIVGPAGGKPLHRFVDGQELDRPPEADAFGPEIGVQFSEEGGRWQVIAGDGSLIQEFDTEGEAHGRAAQLVTP
jgi:hypothetical protein